MAQCSNADVKEFTEPATQKLDGGGVLKRNGDGPRNEWDVERYSLILLMQDAPLPSAFAMRADVDGRQHWKGVVGAPSQSALVHLGSFLPTLADPEGMLDLVPDARLSAVGVLVGDG